ncbi:MAG TPA: hypothetical protein VMU90_13295, partial [Solirubrobacteraceae bacterium]|nr:hypothetical protein [Solirubrobacteraceae bacterium]
MADRTAPDVLRDAADALALAERALAEIINQPGRGRVAGIRNLPVWGRIVTQTIENLRTVVSRDVFNRWWAPWQAQLRDDP